MSSPAPVRGVFEDMRTLSDLLSRYNLATRAGITYGGSRDVYEVLGYKKALSTRDYRERYRRNGIAARIVEAAPKATWRGGAEIREGQDPEAKTPFEEAFKTFARRTNLWSMLLRADILAGFGRYSVILLGTKDGRPLSQPLGSLRSPDDILFLQPFGEDEAQIQTWESNVRNERFGLPNTYRLQRRASATTAGSGGMSLDEPCHWSRLIHVADGAIDDHVYGQPRLERVWNLLDDLEKVTGGGAEAFWQRAHQGMHMDVDKELEMSPDDVTKTKEQLNELVHGMRRFIVSRGSTINALGSDTADISDPSDAIISQISAASGIPKRVLMGSEVGQLASTQDRTNWAEHIRDRRDEFAKPYVLYETINRLILHKALPEPKDTYDVLWPEIRELNQNERADVGRKYAEANQRQGQIIVTAEEIRTRIFGFEPLTEEQKAELERLRKENLNPPPIDSPPVDTNPEPDAAPVPRPRAVGEN